MSSGWVTHRCASQFISIFQVSHYSSSGHDPTKLALDFAIFAKKEGERLKALLCLAVRRRNAEENQKRLPSKSIAGEELWTDRSSPSADEREEKYPKVPMDPAAEVLLEPVKSDETESLQLDLATLEEIANLTSQEMECETQLIEKASVPGEMLLERPCKTKRHNTYKCTPCSRFMPIPLIFSRNMHEVLGHAVQHTPQMPLFRCTKCDQSFFTKYKVLEHYNLVRSKQNKCSRESIVQGPGAKDFTEVLRKFKECFHNTELFDIQIFESWKQSIEMEWLWKAPENAGEEKRSRPKRESKH